jgi:hypothetical protein
MPLQNYDECRARYLSAKGNTSGQILRNALSDAIAEADVCAEIFMGFPAAIEAYVQRLKNDCNRTVATCSAEHIQEQMRKAEQDGDINKIRELVELSRHQKRELQDATAKLNESKFVEDFYRTRVNQLFEGIYATNNSSRSIQAVLDLVDFAVGLTPIGEFIDAYRKIRGILTREKVQVANAEEYLVELERFLETAYFWALISLHVTKNLNSSGDKITLQQAAAEIETRLRQKNAPMVWRPADIILELV